MPNNANAATVPPSSSTIKAMSTFGHFHFLLNDGRQPILLTVRGGEEGARSTSDAGNDTMLNTKNGVHVYRLTKRTQISLAQSMSPGSIDVVVGGGGFELYIEEREEEVSSWARQC